MHIGCHLNKLFYKFEQKCLFKLIYFFTIKIHKIIKYHFKSIIPLFKRFFSKKHQEESKKLTEKFDPKK
jgi:hypothetical protein